MQKIKRIGIILISPLPMDLEFPNDGYISNANDCTWIYDECIYAVM